MRVFTGTELADLVGQLDSIGLLKSDETPRVVCEGSMLGSLRSGLLITDRRVVIYDDASMQAVRFADARSIELEPTGEVGSGYQLTIVDRNGGTLTRHLHLDPTRMRIVAAELRVRAGQDVRLPRPAISEGAAAARVEAGSTRVVLVTTDRIPGRTVRESRGVVIAEAVVDLPWSSEGFGWTEGLVADARVLAFQRVIAAAEELGADAVVGVAVEYAGIGRGGLVSVRGTAVMLDPPPTDGPFR
jgi:uncharacterized protein YbjQ (UPF0145 family)